MHKVAIVTGHSSGLGKAFSHRLIQEGMLVVGVSRRPRVTDLAQDALIEVFGSVSDQSTVNQAFDKASEAGKLALVVNCAGAGVFGPVGSYSVEDMKGALDGNLLGLMAFTDQAISSMRHQGGDIVNVMSTASKKLRAAESVYTAAKWGAKAYTRTVREAVKAEKLPIRVFEVYPCGMNTSFWQEAVRPVTDGSAFPQPGPIAQMVVDALMRGGDSYQQEFLFERS